MIAAIEEVLRRLPDTYQPFIGTEYPMPVAQAMLGELPDMVELRAWLEASKDAALKNACEPVAVAAEVIESQRPNREAYFMSDDEVRSYVFSGAKWRAGWVLVAGDGVTDDLVKQLKEQQYMIFSARHEQLRDRGLAPRETGAVTFLQLMVRYAMIWGQIPPGKDHEMGHFLEQDMPGAMVVRGEVGPVEGLLLLALMKMGCPAVVDPQFPYEIGPRAVATTDDEVFAALGRFPNMRVRVLGGESYVLPEGADPTYLRERVEPIRILQGRLQLRPSASEIRDGVTVTGDGQSDRVTVIIEVADPKIDLPVSAHLERQAAGFGSYLRGIRTRLDREGAYIVELAEGVQMDGTRLGEVIRAGLRRRYPRIGTIHVRVAFGDEALDHEAGYAAAFDRRRDAAILAESEETVEEFHICIDCQPFSHSHVCVVTPGRPPQCGRSRNEIKAAALWGVDYRPWTRREVGGADLQHTVAKGTVIDAQGGEWEGVNAAVHVFSGGQLDRVRIHAVNEAPHTSCGCFGALAFKLPDREGIGVMHRGYKGAAPGGLTWPILANWAGGKQAPGVTGITLSYLKSPKAFAGEGGLAAVKWATSKVFDLMQPYLPPDADVEIGEA
ncbi:MAG: hypothetical protein ACP5JG_12745 [Anaerolineae bacterium]